MTLPTSGNWLSQFPEKRRSLLANLFYQTVRAGFTEPLAIVLHVMHECQRRRQGIIDQSELDHWAHVLSVLREAPAAAMTFAQQVLANEQMPRHEREKMKEAQRKTFILASMKGKPATNAQHWRLRTEGYTGDLPSDRAEASALIERVLQEKNSH